MSDTQRNASPAARCKPVFHAQSRDDIGGGDTTLEAQRDEDTGVDDAKLVARRDDGNLENDTTPDAQCDEDMNADAKMQSLTEEG